MGLRHGHGRATTVVDQHESRLEVVAAGGTRAQTRGHGNGATRCCDVQGRGVAYILRKHAGPAAKKLLCKLRDNARPDVAVVERGAACELMQRSGSSIGVRDAIRPTQSSGAACGALPRALVEDQLEEVWGTGGPTIVLERRGEPRASKQRKRRCEWS